MQVNSKRWARADQRLLRLLGAAGIAVAGAVLALFALRQPPRAGKEPRPVESIDPQIGEPVVASR